MDYERFEEKCAIGANIEVDENREIFELALDELSYVAGGAYDFIAQLKA